VSDLVLSIEDRILESKIESFMMAVFEVTQFSVWEYTDSLRQVRLVMIWIFESGKRERLTTHHSF
jgi:hypothetical protein